MDFFEAQDQARRGTTKLVVLFIFAVIGIVIALNAVGLGVSYWLHQSNDYNREIGVGFDWFQPGLLAIISVSTIVIVGGASLFKTAQLHGDGGKVARLLGGTKVDPNTADADERKLLNIVEEMSLASGVPVPDVYVLNQEQGINAFAAGTNLDHAAVGVTRGCIEKLSRDELQGVIAHEYSHILNGDMKLNLRLIGVVFGILVIGLIGYACFRLGPYLMHSTRSSGNAKEKGGVAVIGLGMLLLGIVIWIIGSIGVFFGRLIQASVSRQREYLADASAVQFTRNPVGIRDALRKIGGTSMRGTLQTSHAGECAHMFFANGFESMFATHPPLPKRIGAIDRNWDGTMLKADLLNDRERLANETRQRKSRPKNVFGPLGDILGQTTGGAMGQTPAGSLLSAFTNAAVIEESQRRGTGRQADFATSNVANRVGQLDQKHIEFAHLMAEAIPEPLRHAVRRPDLCRAVVASLFFSRDSSVRLMQSEALAQKDSQTAQAADAISDVVLQLGPAGRLPLLELAAPVLRTMEPTEATRFLAVLREIIEADDQVEPFEYALYKFTSRLISHAPARERYGSLEQVATEMQIVLSGLASAGHLNDPAGANQAYRLGIGKVQQGQLAFRPDFALSDLDAALDRLAQAKMPVKRAFLEAAAHTVSADTRVTIEEAELLRAISAVLQCPLPPFIDPAGKRGSGS